MDNNALLRCLSFGELRAMDHQTGGVSGRMQNEMV